MADARFSIWPLIPCLLILACASQTNLAPLEDELTDSRKKLKQAQAQNQELTAQKQQLADEIVALREQQQQLKETNRRLSADISKLSKRAQLQEKVIHLLDDTEKTIESSLREQMAAAEIEIVEYQDEVKVVLLDKILYEPGSMEINQKGKILLKTLADSIREKSDQQLVVVGHTDNVPISDNLRSRYPTNWELSAARAAAVIRYLQNECGLDPERISLRAYSHYRPSASNKTEKGRRLNRRIEIILKSTGY